MIKDLTVLFKKTSSHILESAIKNVGAILGLKLDQANGILVSNKKLGTRIQKELDEKTGVHGFISTDELPQYGLTENEKKRILKTFAAAPNDVIVIVADEKQKAQQALTIINTHVAAFQKKQKTPKTVKKKTSKPKEKKNTTNQKTKNARKAKKPPKFSKK